MENTSTSWRAAFSFALVGVKARRGRHVEALCGLDAFPVMNEHERRSLPILGTLDSGCPVRLIAKDQVERPAHRPFAQPPRGEASGRCRKTTVIVSRVAASRNAFEILDGSVVTGISSSSSEASSSLPSGARIRADANVAVWYVLLRRPFTHGLGEQRNRGHEIEHPAANARQRLRRCEAR